MPSVHLAVPVRKTGEFSVGLSEAMEACRKVSACSLTPVNRALNKALGSMHAMSLL